MKNIAPLLALWLCSSFLPAFAQDCPDPCVANVQIASSGSPPNGTFATIVVLGTLNGDCQYLSFWETPLGFCYPKQTCKARLKSMYSGNNTHCIEYNQCGDLGTGPGTSYSTVVSVCGENGEQTGGNLQIEIGTCNPNYDPNNCPPDSPVGSVAYAVVAWLRCSGCL